VEVERREQLERGARSEERVDRVLHFLPRHALLDEEGRIPIHDHHVEGERLKEARIVEARPRPALRRRRGDRGARRLREAPGADGVVLGVR
jgi:hypothetical protein